MYWPRLTRPFPARIRHRKGCVERLVVQRRGRGGQHRLSVFDRFAESASEFASHAVFFIGCTLIVLLWLPSYFVFRNLNTWQLIINTLTTIITFLLVALLQNSQRRSEQAIQHKLDALADGLADLMSAVGGNGDDEAGLEHDVGELRAAVGLEKPVS
ncbi:MAG: low affinity iron permease family protein [Gaiellales bacterium]